MAKNIGRLAICGHRLGFYPCLHMLEHCTSRAILKMVQKKDLPVCCLGGVPNAERRLKFKPVSREVFAGFGVEVGTARWSKLFSRSGLICEFVDAQPSD